MITPKPAAEASVLVVGADDAVRAIVKSLEQKGVGKVETLSASDRDPEEFIKADPDHFLSYDLVIVANQERNFELAVSELRWKAHEDGAPEKPMMVMRSVANNCKFRCQYHQLKLEDGATSTFVSLPMDLLPWTDEKRQLVASSVIEEFQPAEDPDFLAYLKASVAAIAFHKHSKSWPTPADVEKLRTSVTEPSEATDHYLTQICEGGLASVPKTIEVIARLISRDAVKLITSGGQPINNSNIDDILELTARNL